MSAVLKLFDKESPRRAYKSSRKVERQYTASLRRVARHIGDIVASISPDGSVTPEVATAIDAALNRYADVIEPWSKAVASRMIAEVAARDEATWFDVSRKMGRALRKEIATAPTGTIMRERLADQVRLITSLPREAAQRVRSLANEAIVQGTRPAELAKEIMRTGEVTESRAILIARTETSRTATELTRARAEHVGSPGYWWRTAGDSDVRESHRKMNGKFIAWNDPPTLDGMTGHAGQLPNCRCFCDVALDNS
ncbi:phage minor head protein [Xanthobacter sp. V3C-3]|uniref:phage head morphogenesis protein n=1 Tax=Xanthobacter lutulentifluminis TaxID=3119935 RepID=UPI003727BB0B